MLSISTQEVQHVANLARLSLTEKEVDIYTEHLNSILEFAQKLNELDTEHVKPTSHALDLSNVLREDEKRDSIPREVALKNAPDHRNGQFKVPAVMEG
ncbi:Asp-tRNA(Asn)/Glu-tRNA(Gln) amidotransferase subunit GatC [Tepidibacillus infernus]|uniref:Aspartyl/glutamyl-tRNA(Asn/Gln) amidotransferase subunit C n=1 Tax=Tepidibacillus decaturensis TaxID=1413211 RepID=A0A135L7J2_9BACI|nr:MULTISPECIES: Asp-tRNA(Asn)/Glu-tRNA(Gln) amidotransferase subunit GatC [Tepidibacillus]KXG44942.1 glutamyl-tRNA amidotransferase [Tepidibacillus decaturensis]